MSPKGKKIKEIKMKVTVDTNFLISATQWDYSVAHKLLKKFILSDTKRFTIFTTQDILDETLEVLERDFEYNKNEAKNIIEKILLFVSLIEPKQKVNIVKDDPDDNKVVECAVESSSDYIITYDKHLLKLKEYNIDMNKINKQKRTKTKDFDERFIKKFEEMKCLFQAKLLFDEKINAEKINMETKIKIIIWEITRK